MSEAEKIEQLTQGMETIQTLLNATEQDRDEWKKLAELADAKLVALREKLQDAIETIE